MASDVRQRQNNTEQEPCGGSPVSADALTPSSLQPNGSMPHGIVIKEQCADVSKSTNPSPSLPGSATASATTDGPVMSHSTSAPTNHTSSSSPSESVSPSPSHSMSQPSTNSPSSPVPESSTESSTESSQSFVKATDPAATSSPAAEPSSPVATTTSPSEPRPVSATSKPPNPEQQTTHAPNIQLPGLAAANPPASSRTIDLEAAPATTSPPTSTSRTGEAAAEPAPANPADEDGDAGAAPAIAPSPTQSSGQGTALPSEILNPVPSDPAGLSPAPSTLMTDIPPPSSSIILGTSSTLNSPESSNAAPTATNGGAGATPTTTLGGDLLRQTNRSGSSPPMGVIVGSAVGGAAGLAILALLFWMWRRRAQKKKELGRPLTPLADRPGHQPAADAATTGPFAAGRQASTRARNQLQGWWASHGASHGRAAAIAPEYGDKQTSTNMRDDSNPFSDVHSTEAQRTAPILTPQQQILRGILKQPAGASLHGRHPSDSPSIAAAGAARRSRSHSISTQKGALASSQQQRPAASRRTSSLTQDPFQDRRTKFRSDPFDLELDTRMLSSSSTSASQRDPRESSMYSASSRYTSGASTSAWDPAAGSGRPGVSDSPTLPLRTMRSGGVGQAM